MSHNDIILHTTSCAYAFATTCSTLAPCHQQKGHCQQLNAIPNSISTSNSTSVLVAPAPTCRLATSGSFCHSSGVHPDLTQLNITNLQHPSVSMLIWTAGKYADFQL